MTRRNTLAWMMALAALLVTPHFAGAEARQTQDEFVGNGTTGPYTLSWKNILAGTERVTVNDVPVIWGADYTLDPTSGTLAFTHPLPAQAGATIRYGYDTAQSQPQGSALNLPLAAALNPNVSLVGAYSHVPSDGQTPGALNVGLNGDWQGANSNRLVTHLLFVPAMTGADAQAAPNGLDRLGFDALGQTRLGKPLTLSFGFSRAGLGMGSVGSDNWQAGVQKATLNAAFTPTQQVQATLGYAQTDPANGRGPAAQSQIAAALSVSPNSRMQFKTGLTQTQGGGSGPAQTVTASADVRPTGQADLSADYAQTDATGRASDAQTLNLKAALSTGKALSLVATNAQTSVGQGGTTQTQTVAATVKPLSGAELDAAYSQKDAPGKGNDTQSMAVKAALGTGKPLSLTASLDQSTQGTQDTDAQAVRLSLAPQASLQLNTGLSLRQTPTQNSQAAAVDGKAQPWAFLLLSGGYQWRTVTPAQVGGAADGNYPSSSAQVTLAPRSALRLVGTYAQNPDAADGTPQRLAQRGVDLQAQLGAFSLTGGCDWSRQYATPTTGTSVHVGLGLRFSANTQLTGDYKQDLIGVGTAPAGTSAYTVGLTRNLGERFNLSLNGTMQQAVGPGSAAPANVTASANLGMKF